MIAMFPEMVSERAKARMLSAEGGPLFLNDWVRALMMHYRIRPEVLQPIIPLPLDVRDGWAYISLVAFEMRRLRPSIGGKIAEWLSWPLARHGFFNVRTYVRTSDEPGIYFMLEWLPNQLAVMIGPRLYGLPYKYGRLDYRHGHERNRLAGEILDPATGGRFAYHGVLAESKSYEPSCPGSLSAFLMERYTAYTAAQGILRRFRVWHRPWPQQQLELSVSSTSLLQHSGSWFEKAEPVGANYSPGVFDVWVGRPQRISGSSF